MKHSFLLLSVSVQCVLAIVCAIIAYNEETLLEVKIRSTPDLTPEMFYHTSGSKKISPPVSGKKNARTYGEGFRKFSFPLPNKKIEKVQFTLAHSAYSAEIYDAKITEKHLFGIGENRLAGYPATAFTNFSVEIAKTSISDGILSVKTTPSCQNPSFALQINKQEKTGISTKDIFITLSFAFLFTISIQVLSRFLKFKSFSLFHELSEACAQESPLAKTSALLTLRLKREYILLCFSTLVAFLAYWQPLTTFVYSNDTGMPTFSTMVWKLFIHEARWGCALFAYILPTHLGALPFLPTAICCGALAFFASKVAMLTGNGMRWQFCFCALFVSCPIFFYQIVFPINSYVATGIGLILTALALSQVFANSPGKNSVPRTSHVLKAILLLTCAIGCYQSQFFIFIITAILILAFRTAILPRLSLCVGISAVSLVLSLLIGHFVAFLFGTKITEHLSFPGFSVIFSNLTKGFEKLISIFTGSSSLYVSPEISRGCLFVFWAGSFLLFANLAINPNKQKMKIALLSLCAVAAFFSIVFATNYLPLRALCAFAAVYAFAGAAVAKLKFPKLTYIIVAISVFFNCYLGTSLYYSENVARDRDNTLLSALLTKMYDVEPNLGRKDVRCAIIGTWEHERTGVTLRHHLESEFGQSHFNTVWPQRYEAYFRLMGIARLHAVVGFSADKAQHVNRGLPVDVALRAECEHPAFPQKGSVWYEGDTMMIKLGALANYQRRDLKSKIGKFFENDFARVIAKRDINSLPVLPSSHMEMCREIGDELVLGGWAFSAKEGGAPFAFYIRDTRTNQFLEIQQNTLFSRADMARVTPAARNSGFMLYVKKNLLKANGCYQIYAYFPKTRTAYKMPKNGQIKDVNIFE